MKRVLRDLWVAVFASRGCIHFARIFPAKRLMRAVIIVTLDKVIEAPLLLQKVITGWLGRLQQQAASRILRSL